MSKALDHDRLKKLLGLLGSDHDGEVLNAARRIDAMIRSSGTDWDRLIVTPSPVKTDKSGDAKLLDDLLASENVTDVLKLRLSAMRAALSTGRLGEADRRFLRILHRKAVVEGTIIVD